MINVLAEVSINDLAQFIKVFSEQGLAARRKFKSLKSEIFEIEAEPNRVFIVFEWESRADFERFLADPEVRETMKASGTNSPPKFTFLKKIAEFSG